MKLLIVSLVALASLVAAYPAGRAVPQRVDDIDDVLEDAIERYLDPKGLLGVDVDIVDHDEDIPDADDILELDFDDDAKDRYKVHLLPVGTAGGVQFLPIEKSETGRKFRIRRPPPPGVDAAIDARVWPSFSSGAGSVRPKFDIVGIDPGYSARSAVGSGPAGESTVVIGRHDDDIDDIREDIAEKIADAHEDIVEARHPELEAAADAAEDAADAHEDAIEAVIEGKSPVEVAVEAREDAIEDHIDAVEDKIEADIAASVLAGGAPVGSGGGGKSAGGPGPVIAVSTVAKGGPAPAAPAAGGVEAAIAKAVVADAQRELREDIAESNADLNEAKLELAADLANPLKTPVQAHREYAAEVAETKVDLDEDVREFAAKTRTVAKV